MTQTPEMASRSTAPKHLGLHILSWSVVTVAIATGLDCLFGFFFWHGDSTYEQALLHGSIRGFILIATSFATNWLMGNPLQEISGRGKLGPYRPPGWAQRQEVLALIVKHATDAVASEMSQRSPSIVQHFFYGAIGINPCHLATWYLFRTDAELAEARSSGLTDHIADLTRSNLTAYGYPAEAIPNVSISFTTDEDIQRKTGGNYRYYFQ